MSTRQRTMATSSGNRSRPPFPPWGEGDSWREINLALGGAIADLGAAGQQQRDLAVKQKNNLTRLGDVLERAARHCCPDCSAICCLHAKPFYNFQDLVYLHLAGIQPPQTGQPIRTAADSCRYLTKRGCSLARSLRPWICTWYICPAMRDVLVEQLPTVTTLIATIKEQRRELEASLLDRLITD